MKNKRSWKLALLLLVPLALYFYIAERNSWRPRTIRVPKGTLSGIEFSPDGRSFVCTNCPHSEVDVCDVLCFDVASQKTLMRKNAANSPFYTGGGKFLFVFCRYLGLSDEDERGQIIFLDGKTKYSIPPYFKPFDVLSDGKTLIGNMTKNANHNDLYSWNIQNSTAPKLFFPFPPQLNSKSTLHGFLADKSTILVEVFNFKGHGTLQFWNAKTRKLRFAIPERETLQEGRTYMLAGYSSSPSGLFVFYNSNRVEIWNYKTGQKQNSFSITLPHENIPPTGNLYLDKCSISSDGTLLVGSSVMGNSMVLWETKTGKVLRQWSFAPTYLIDLQFSPNSQTLVATFGDGTLKLWRIK